MSSAIMAWIVLHYCAGGTIGGELASDQAQTSRHNLAFGWTERGSDHDAAMRIGGVNRTGFAGGSKP
jgi:hypothetical protein